MLRPRSQCGGPFGGYTTEADFYRSMFRSDVRNNPFLIILAGLAAIPIVAATVSVANGWAAGARGAEGRGRCDQLMKRLNSPPLILVRLVSRVEWNQMAERC